MADYLFKNGGTAGGTDDGRYTTPQTGSFATLGTANYYNDLDDAMNNSTTAPTAGDRLLGSDLHTFSTTAILNINIAGTSIICVDDANVDQARTSGNRAVETVTSASNDILISADIIISGFELSSSDDITFNSPAGAPVIMDCKLIAPGSGDSIHNGGDGTHIAIVNTEIALDNAGAFMRVQNGGSIDIYGGSVTTTSAGITSFFSGGFNNGGGDIRLSGVDISAVTGTLIAGIGASGANDDTIDVIFDMCKLDSGVAFTNETFKSQNHRALFTRCSDSSSAAEHQYHLHAFGGDVDDDSTIRRADDPAFEDSNTIISYKIVTNSDASLGSPLRFDFPNPRWAALSSTDTDTLRFHVASTVALTNKDIYIEILYPDGTNKQTPNFFSSANTTVGGTLDLMAAGTTLTTDSGSDWRDGGSALTGHNEYQIDVTTTGDVGADTKAIVKVYITKASTTIQLAPIYDLN